ncbi:MAG TPA: alpha/beta fold hydrolase [Candidatus Acidoferrales bacterium]|nr:alpha/beta fold hydrolase [Candidatus Acidoferrales bacterium]
MRFHLGFWAFVLAVAVAAAMARADALPRRGSMGAVMAAGPNATVVVSQVLPNSAAAAGGVEAGDVVTAVDGSPVATVPALLAAIHRPAGQTVTLTINRNGAVRQLTFALHEAARESDPAVETIYDSISVDGSLRRTLVTVPLGVSGRRPAVLFVGGIGCYSIDNALDRNDAYHALALDLSRRGFVTMRVEKSGLGDSQGAACSSVDFDAESRSYAVALDALRTNDRVLPGRVYVFGHSIGGTIGPRLAVPGSGVAGLIVAETVGIDWFTYEMINERRQAVLDNLTPAQIDADAAGKEFCMHEVLIAKKTTVQAVAENPACNDYRYPAADAYMQQVAALNVADAWMKLDVPVLAIYGRADFITDESDHRRIVAIANAAHPGSATLATIDDMDHYLVVSPSQAASFARVRKAGAAGPYNEKLSATIAGWLCERERCTEPPAAAPTALR